MNADPLAEWIAGMWNMNPEVPLYVMVSADECAANAAWMRAHRDDLLRALGGTEHQETIAVVDIGGDTRMVERTWRFESPRSVWVFAEHTEVTR